jgi:glutamyl-tRNA synthetase
MKIYRVAPSPTGNMHLGNARTAILNKYASLQDNINEEKAKFFLRIDDTDSVRDKEEYEQNIFKDLEWLKIDYFTCIKQSERLEIYEKHLQELIKSKKVYECFETEEELDKNMYNQQAFFLNEEQKNELRKTRVSYWRFYMSQDIYEFQDTVMGKIKIKRSWSDPVIKRPDQIDKFPFTYNWTCAIDDYLMKVTDIIRGEEHLVNAIIQQEIIKCFADHKIQYAHLPVIITPSGQKLSKRLGDLSIQTLRQEGIHYTTIISTCLFLGINKCPLITSDLKALVKYFSLKSFSRASPKFEKRNIEILNTKILRQLSLKDIHELKFDINIWEIIKNNITHLNDYYKWEKILNYNNLYQGFLYKDILKLIYKNNKLCYELMDNIILKKDFLHNLRLSLTNETFGPEIEKILNYKIKIRNIFDKIMN